MLRCFWIAGLLHLAATSTPAIAQDSPALQRFLSEASGAWKNYLEHTKRLVGKYEVTSARFEKPEGRESGEFKQAEGRRLHQMTSFPVAPGTEANSFVWASNRDYAFQLWTKDPSKGWAVKEIRLNQKDLDAFDELGYRSRIDKYSRPRSCWRTPLQHQEERSWDGYCVVGEPSVWNCHPTYESVYRNVVAMACLSSRRRFRKARSDSIMRRSFLLIWLLTGLGLVAASAVGFLTPADKSGAVIEEPERVFASMPLGKHEVRIRISNPTRHVVRVVGTSDFCGIGSCFTSKHPLPAEIPPGGAMELIAELRIARVGEFSSEMYVYLDDLGLRQEVLTASGTATDSGEKESH